MTFSNHFGNDSEDFIPILVRKTEYNMWSKNMTHPLFNNTWKSKHINNVSMSQEMYINRKKDPLREHTKVPNRVYMKFIEGIELTPAATSTNVREAWMLIVIYKKKRKMNTLAVLSYKYMNRVYMTWLYCWFCHNHGWSLTIQTLTKMNGKLGDKIVECYQS